MSKDVTRLFKQFVPEHYDLSLMPDRDAMTFTGTVTIRGRRVGRPSQRLTFHQNGLKITSATAVRKDKKGEHAVTIDRINHHKSFDEVRLHTAHMLYPGEYTVTMTFSGKITRPMNGIYPCFFQHDGKQKQLIATQFESHHAREAFPCIDEPEAKAMFQLTLTTPVSETVISNTPIASEKKTKHTKTTTFETTPKMSTYLLAFVYGEMGYKQAKTKDGTVVRAYATPDNVQFTDFALETAIKVLEFYNDYFDLPYPLSKYDMIALPDFAAGAMENWGCVTYREQCLLVDPKNTSLATKQYVAVVVAHELTHQWFGNLVTMRWWTDLWLNEGFASWMEYLAVDRLFPDWEMWTQFVIDDQQPALKLDALENTHPIEVPVHHPDEIRTIFDTISYNKGSSIIHMLHQYLGPDVFRDGLRHYLKKHSYSNTDTVDLWESLEHVSKKPVKQFMHAWTTQPGFPIIQANINQDDPTLTQERFYMQRPSKNNHEIWPIPLLANEPVGFDTLHEPSKKLAVTKLTDKFLLNFGRSGFYRVVYDAPHLNNLAKAVAANKVSPLDRLGLLADSSEASRAGYGNTVDTLQLLASYSQEDNCAVWDVIASVIGGIRGVMDDEQLREDMKPFVRKLVAQQLKRLGWVAKKGESHFDSLLRPTILGMAAAADDPAVLKECHHRFKTMKRPEDLPPDLRGVIYTVVARHGDSKTFDRLLQLHDATTSSEEQTTLAAAITNFKQPALAKRALDLITSDTVRMQDVSYWIAYSFMNRFAKDAAWEWLKKHWGWLEQNMGNDLGFYRFPIYAARSFSNASFAPKYKKFFEPKLSPAMKRPYHQGLEIIEWQSAWRTRDLKPIKVFFAAKS